MATLTLDSKYMEILRTLDEAHAVDLAEKILEEAVHNYAFKQIDKRIERARQEVEVFETQYGMPYEQFYERVATDEAFLEELKQKNIIWELDINAWEYYAEELIEWLGRLESISKL